MSFKAGQQLKRVRDELGLTMRDVENASSNIAAKFGNEEFSIPISRLSDIESKGTLPNMFRVFSLSAIYGLDYEEFFALYGIDLEKRALAHRLAGIRKSHLFSTIRGALKVRVPTTVDPSFDVRRTNNMMRMIQKWGTVPATFLSELAGSGHNYAFIGTEDFTMYPLIMPGSLLQIDETRTRVINEGWRSEYERPIYCIETREEIICSWCKVDNERLITQPHGLSPAMPRTFKHPQEAEVIGQVVALAMRLDEWVPDDGKQKQIAEARPN